MKLEIETHECAEAMGLAYRLHVALKSVVYANKPHHFPDAIKTLRALASSLGYAIQQKEDLKDAP